MEKTREPGQGENTVEGSGVAVSGDGVGASGGGVAVGGDVGGDVQIYHVAGNLTIVQQGAATEAAARATLMASEAAPIPDFWDDLRRQKLAGKQRELRALLARLSHFEQQAAAHDPGKLPWSLASNLQAAAEAVERVRQEVEVLSG